MPAKQHRWFVTVIGLAMLSCIIAAVWSPASPTEDLFLTAVNALKREIDEPFFVDPRPVSITLSQGYPVEADYYIDADSVAANRLLSLAAAGIEPTKALPLLKDCTGILVLPPHRATSGCPESHRLEVLLDVLRRHEHRDAWAMKGFMISYGSSGKSGSEFDLIMTRVGTEWKVEIVYLLVLD